MKISTFLIFFLLLHPVSLFSQIDEFFLTASGNFYLPVNNDSKGIYPVLGYDKDTDPKLLVGGYGIGLSMFRHINNSINFKGHVNFTRSVYWDEPLIANTGPNPVDVIAVINSSSVDYTMGLCLAAHYLITQKLSAGTGLGTHVLLTSLSHLPHKWDGSAIVKGPTAVNQYYKRLMPVLPVELSLKFEKILFNIRYEYGLLNRLKKDLARHKTDRYALLTFEMGVRIK